MSFVHLHAHSEYSPDGAGRITSMVERAKKIGAPALAITDHGTLAGAVSFWAACKDAGIKPILGLEGYLLWNGKRHHITLNSINKEGFNNLINISNQAHQRYTSGYPLIYMEDFERWHKGIIVLTGCPASAIHAREYEDGRDFVAALVAIFGRDRVFAEIMFVMSTDFISRPFQIAQELDLKIAITNDAHFHEEQQARAHKIITSCRKGYNYESASLWLKTYSEMERTGLNIFHPANVKEWLSNSNSIADMVEPWSMYAPPSLPVTVGAEEELKSILVTAFEKDIVGRKPEDVATRKKRLNYEFKMLKQMGFMDYNYILYDIINEAKRLGVRVGPGRGSAAGSYVLYLLGVTGVDPVKYNLMFERYINPARKSYPDVDVDFESERRHEVLEYANKRWGALPVATYTHYSHKTAVADLGRVLSLPKYLTDAAADATPDSEEFETFCEANPDVRIAYSAMVGQVRNRGKHAGGIVITSVPVPVESNGKELLVAWTEGKDKQVTKAGVVKFDMLGLVAVAQVQSMVEMLGKEPPDPEADMKPYNIFRKGDVNGIFQWAGSDGIRRLTMEIKPRNITDLAVINSLYRPGALDAGTAKDYPKYQAEPRKIDSRIDDILAETNGVIVFQEQVMAVFARVVGGSLADADLARRVIVKSRRWDPEWLKELEALKIDFIARGQANGYEEELLEFLWSELMTHSRYSFNKSHSLAYAWVAYQMAWFKYYHPTIFYTSILRHDVSQAQTFLIEAAYKGIQIMPPHINYSSNQYDYHDGKIYLPLTAVSYFGANGAKTVYDERQKNGLFLSFSDFNSRIPKKACTARSRALLFQIGGFDGLKGMPNEAIRNFDELESLTKPEAQLKTLGFVLPTPELAKFIMRSEEDGAVTGFVLSWRDKSSGHGPYRVFKLSPRGSFWCRDTDSAWGLEKGVFVRAKKLRSGRAKDVEVLSI